MNRPTRPLAIFLAALVLSVAAHGVGRAQETKLTVMVFRGGQNLPLFAAQEQGFLAKRGIAVNVLFAPSADELPRVLADGRVQIIHSTSDNVVKITPDFFRVESGSSTETRTSLAKIRRPAGSGKRRPAITLVGSIEKSGPER